MYYITILSLGVAVLDGYLSVGQFTTLSTIVSHQSTWSANLANVYINYPIGYNALRQIQAIVNREERGSETRAAPARPSERLTVEESEQGPHIRID